MKNFLASCKDKCSHGAAGATLITAWLIIVYIAYLAFYPFKTIEFNKDIFPVQNKTIEQGGILAYETDGCKYSDAVADIQRTFVNSLVYDMPLSVSTRELGCRADTIHLHVPEQLPPGDYHLRIKVTYKLNPFKTIVITKETEHFEIIEK